MGSLFMLPLWAFMGNPKSHISGVGKLAGRQENVRFPSKGFSNVVVMGVIFFEGVIEPGES